LPIGVAFEETRMKKRDGAMDGDRTRDNRNHNPNLYKQQNQVLTPFSDILTMHKSGYWHIFGT